MKQILLSLFLVLSLSAYSAHHEEGELKNQFQLLSTYEIAAGQNPQDLAEELMEMQKNQESYGYNNCGVYQHQFGAMRGFYTYCNFDDMKQFAAVMKKSIAAQSTDPSPVQSYASHSDNIVGVLERNFVEKIFSSDNYNSDKGKSNWWFGCRFLTLYADDENKDNLTTGPREVQQPNLGWFNWIWLVVISILTILSRSGSSILTQITSAGIPWTQNQIDA